MSRRTFSGALTELFDSTLAPLAAWTDGVLLITRLIVGVLMIYYGWPAKNAHDFKGNGFKPGWAFGSPVLMAEFFGGILVLLGAYVWVAAAAFGFEMLLGTVVKATKSTSPTGQKRCIT